jgi:hypothetical protein
MGENRESVILVKSPNFKDEDAKFTLGLRVDFGTTQCSQRMEQHKALGVEPANNCFVVTHDFETEEGAQQAATKAMELKAMIPPLKSLESAKAVGKKLVLCVRPDDHDMERVKIIADFATFLGEFAAVNQYFELRLGSSRDLKAILGDQSASPLALALETFCFKTTLSARKELPIKIADFAASLSTSAEEQQNFKLAGRCFGAFHHLTYTVDLKEQTSEMRETLREQITGALMMGAQMAYGMLSSFGVMEVVKSGGASTRLTFCLSPLLSLEVNLFAPKALEVFTQLATQGGEPA